ncbi:MAG: hypothetical protein J6A29_03255 [Clostridia bacterium]|nr:hypothetical protein [Clostridia bacterium]
MLELAIWEEIAIVGVFALATITLLIIATSAFKLKNQKVIFGLALGIAFCFAIIAILFARDFGFFQ